MATKRLSGLWLRDGKRGKYMSGSLTEAIPAGAKLLIFKNDRETGPNAPHYTLHIAVDDESPSAERSPYAPPHGSAGGKHAPAVGDSTRNIHPAMTAPLNATPAELAAGDDIPF
jgi:hypothetical protein